MVYDIGDKSILFKYISLNLKNLYMSSLRVSSEYTLELAKTIYSFLQSCYPQQTIIDKYDHESLSESIATYYLHGIVDYSSLKYIIILPEYDLGNPQKICGVYKYGGKLNDTPLFNFNAHEIDCLIGANVLWKILPEDAPYYNVDQIWQYLPAEGTKFINTPDEVVDGSCVYIGSNPDNEYYKRFYVAHEHGGYIDVTHAVSGYLFLDEVFTTDNYVFPNSLDDIDLTSYYEDHSNDLVNYNYNVGATIYPQDSVQYDEDGNISVTYDYNSIVTPKSIDEINSHNLVHWYLNDVVIQYLQPGIVISENNYEDDIAQAQYQLMNYNYVPSYLGKIDNAFTFDCYQIQEYLRKRNPIIACTGYFDIYVEGYARSLGEVRA